MLSPAMILSSGDVRAVRFRAGIRLAGFLLVGFFFAGPFLGALVFALAIPDVFENVVADQYVEGAHDLIVFAKSFKHH